MYESKKWYASKTIWGGLASVVAGAGLMLGMEIDTAHLTEILASLAAIVGGLMATVGRKVASKRIG